MNNYPCCNHKELKVSHSQKDLLPGLEVRLLSHQAIGVAWYAFREHSLRTRANEIFRMLAKEKSSDKGGILAYVASKCC